MKEEEVKKLREEEKEAKKSLEGTDFNFQKAHLREKSKWKNSKGDGCSNKVHICGCSSMKDYSKHEIPQVYKDRLLDEEVLVISSEKSVFPPSHRMNKELIKRKILNDVLPKKHYDWLEEYIDTMIKTNIEWKKNAKDWSKDLPEKDFVWGEIEKYDKIFKESIVKKLSKYWDI